MIDINTKSTYTCKKMEKLEASLAEFTTLDLSAHSNDMDIAEERIGAHRMPKIYAWKTMLDMGIHACGGSDAPVESFSIMENIHFAVTRKKLCGLPENGWIPSEKMSIDEAVKLFTKYAAYASYTEQENGTIEPGKNADFAICEKDLYTISADDIKDVKIDMTVIGGDIVYNRI